MRKKGDFDPKKGGKVENWAKMCSPCTKKLQKFFIFDLQFRGQKTGRIVLILKNVIAFVDRIK